MTSCPPWRSPARQSPTAAAIQCIKSVRWRMPGGLSSSLCTPLLGYSIPRRGWRRCGDHFRPARHVRSAKGAARTAKRIRSKFALHSVLRVLLKSAKGAARTSKRIRNKIAPHSVLRVLLKSWAPERRDQMKEERALAKRCHPHESAIDGCSQVLESITRQSVFLKSANGAARTAKRIRSKFALHSVLRVFLGRRHRALPCP